MARRHRVDGDAIAGEFDGEALRQAPERVFRGDIGRRIGIAETKPGGEVDDAPALCPHHRSGGGPAGQERPAGVDALDAVPLVGIGVDQ
jgi:hypothetical protein